MKKATWLISSSLPAWQKSLVAELKRRCPDDSDLTWILSSGTQSVDQVKAIGLSQAALESSARAVNELLRVKPADRWLLALPEYHIGGHAIFVRARLSGSRVYRLPKWIEQAFVRSLIKNKITLCSLVPTQLHDLVAARLRCPSDLRAMVIGGGSVSRDLYHRARQLGWPVLPSYGMTECASQVATADLGSLRKDDFPALKILRHAKIKISDGRLMIRSEAACSFVATINRSGEFTLEEPLRDGWLPTEDMGEVKDGALWPLGRRDELVKILGVLVSVPQVEHDLRQFVSHLSGDFGVISFSSARSGAELVLVTDSSDSLKSWDRATEKYNQQASGPWRVSRLCWVSAIPRTSLNKLKRAELRRLILNEGLRARSI